MQLARTPVNFPKMKIRGRRNKAKTAARHTTTWEARVNVTSTRSDEGLYLTRLIVDPNGSHVVKQSVTRDGWGRTL